MATGGRKSAAVFQRYDIVGEDNLAEAARGLDEEQRNAEAQAEAAWAESGHNLNPTQQAKY